MNNIQFAEKIYTLRSERGISQKELGDLLGVSNKAVSKWENGESMPKTATLLKIAEVFSLDVNELMGGEVKSAPESQSSDELDSLKAENALLRTQITQSDKKKRIHTVLAAVLCIAIISACGIFAFISGRTDADNRGLSDLGKAGTTIQFAERTFEPLSDLDKLYYKSGYYLDDSKEATYTDLSGKTSKVIIKCNNYTEIIDLVSGGKTVRYIDSEHHIKIRYSSVSEIQLEYGDTVSNTYSDYRYTHTYYKDVKEESPAVKAFCNFYADKKETADKRATDLYLGHNGCSVTVRLSSDSVDRSVTLGEFFVGYKGAVYFYDYSDTKTYDVGKEMAKYVKVD